ncbi:MAG: S9 family peptidase [Fimbriimonadaceae bacterium]|nr:S9 family peptidase [Fimbriimonadaceae bacterium]QYK56716.1 MAG: S9 family peptidase [Fimbriimonadaceae bacterium]
MKIYRPLWAPLLATALATTCFAQRTLEGSEIQRQAQQFSRDAAAFRTQLPIAQWIGPAKLAYQDGEEWAVFDAKTGNSARQKERPESEIKGGGRQNRNARRRSPGRAAQFGEAFSPDGKVRIYNKDDNAWLDREGQLPLQLTTDGGNGLKYAAGTWVYGEELYQSEACGVSSDGRWAWYYRMDERKVPMNMVVRGQRSYRATFGAQAYPKTGDPNPQADVFVVEVATGESRLIEARPGPFDDAVGHLVYDIEFSPDSREVYFRRTDRRQKTMEWCAADPATGRSRVVVRESSPDTYTPNNLGKRWLSLEPDIEKRADLGKSVLWASDRNGYINEFLLDTATGKTTQLTDNKFDVTGIERLQLDAGRLFYMAGSQGNPYLRQLWVVGLDGKNNRRLTEPSRSHSVDVSPDGTAFLDRYESIDAPPALRVVGLDGKVLLDITKPLMPTAPAGMTPAQRFEYLAADGKTPLFARISKPRNFDPMRKYPLLISVYGGPLDPAGGDHSEFFGGPDRLAGYGFVVADLTNRGTGGRGKAHRDATYGKLGIVDIDDMAAGVRALLKAGYIDPDRIGIYGTSYGGYSSLISILRYPELYRAASASSGVTDWRHYDSIYTERYMNVVADNEEGYKAGSAMTYVANLKGWIQFYFGTADDNVLPGNSLQVVDALNRAGKPYDMIVGVDAGHSGVNDARMVEFFLNRMEIPWK